MGWVTPIAGPGAVIGATIEDEKELFLTSRGYLRGMGLGEFSRLHARDGAVLKGWAVIEGYWRKQAWVSGLSLARAIYGPAGRDYPYEEVP
jgi:hypothetical protein